MLIRPSDASRNSREWRSFLRSQGFGHFIASGVGRDFPVVAPTQFAVVGDELVFHLAAANPVFAALAERATALMSVAGDWAYVPAAWKVLPGEDPTMGIPTTYYAAVQVAGPVTVVDEPEEVAEILRSQLAVTEPNSDVADPFEAHPRQLGAIRGLRLPLAEPRAKFKYGGNVSEQHRSVVASHLAARSGPGDEAALDHLERRG